MVEGSPETNLSEAASAYLASLPEENRETAQQEVYRFVRWFGWECSFASITPAGVEGYAERLETTARGYTSKLAIVKDFLAWSCKKGWSKTNLSIHLKAKKSKNGAARQMPHRPETEPVVMSREGLEKMKVELETLHAQPIESIAEIQKAAADKDFRENAPLHAAREQRSRLEGRILELEEALKAAVIMDEKPRDTVRIDIGDSVVIADLETGQEMCYKLVGPREVAPAKGWVSGASPLGRAIVGKGEGDKVEVVAPAGKRRYEIKKVESRR